MKSTIGGMIPLGEASTVASAGPGASGTGPASCTAASNGVGPSNWIGWTSTEPASTGVPEALLLLHPATNTVLGASEEQSSSSFVRLMETTPPESSPPSQRTPIDTIITRETSATRPHVVTS